MKINALDALPIAEALVDRLRPACERIEIAGSLRRQEPFVKDIELVAVSRVVERVEQRGFFADDVAEHDTLEETIRLAIGDGWLALRDVEIHRKDGSIETQQRAGDRYKALVFEGVPVDLFVVRPPAEWGVVFAIRTGPADFNQRIVTDCQRFFLRVENGRLWHFREPVECPEETDFFRNVGQRWLAPNERRASLVRLARQKGLR